jgi:hypothetical protein
MAQQPPGDPPALEQVLDALFSAPPGEFVERRDRAARQLRAGGDPAGAAQVKALRRPTQSAWLVNRLVRERADVVAELLSLGAALREAQDGLDGEALRALSARRRAVVDALVRDAVRLAAGDSAAPAPAADVRAEVQATLEAALLDPGAAADVRRGTLSRPLRRTGLEAVELFPGGSAPLQPGRRGGAARPPTRAGAPAGARAGEARRRRAALEQAEDALARAERARDATVAAAQEAASRKRDLGERLGELREEVTDVERRLAEASLEVRGRDRERVAAEAAVQAARRAADRARAPVEGE